MSPESGTPLEQAREKLISIDGKEQFFVKDGIAVLLNPDKLDKVKCEEMETFDGLNLHNAPYFRKNLLKRVISQIELGETGMAAEMGGGEGYFARCIAETLPGAKVYVCDLSFRTLQYAPSNLLRICADVTRPIFEKGSLKLVVFWVSLHHLEKHLWRKGLEEAAAALAPNGILVIFEPNDGFCPRRIMYKSCLRSDVYFDKYEQAIDFSEVKGILKDLGLAELKTAFLNPPYNFYFVKKLRRGYLYMPVLECLYLLDRWILDPFIRLFLPKKLHIKRYLSLYGLAIYQKKP